MAQALQFPHDDFGDRYAIERELGHGATATVYLARDLKFDDKLVAIKVLSADFALPVPSERFLREIQTTAKLNHPHIVTLMESGRTRGAPRRPFYVMRYIDGETLRDIIARGPLAVDEALRITRQVAGALGHAHRHGLIHRDIKPGNIMIEDGHTWVTDFGIARAMAAKEGQTVTSTGVTIGTPAYMSPEQAMGQGNLDARTDIYSLGCVLYEMLAGKMPFEGPDIQAVMNKHLVEPLPPIRDFRSDVPERVAQLLNIALAKKRDDRFATAAEFADALSLEGGGALTPTRTQPVRGERRKRITWRPWTTLAAGVTSGIGIVALAAWALTRPALRMNRYLVSPRWTYDAGLERLDASRLLQDALNEWRGIELVGESQARTPGNVSAIARQNNAGWYITGVVSQVGDSVRVRATLYGTRGNSLVRERSVNVSPSLRSVDSAFIRLADRLLFDDTVWSANGGRAGTRSVRARHALADGLSAVHNWQLPEADSAFSRAALADEQFFQAHLWLAQVRFWQNQPTATWRSSAERAANGSAVMSVGDTLLATALRLLARDEVPAACSIWDALTRQRPSDIVGWYGLGNCLSHDDIVVGDARSPSGWSFRSSYSHAINAFRHTFDLLPSIHKALGAESYAAVRNLLKTNADGVRTGRALSPDTTTFIAHMSWIADTLAFVPYPTRVIEAGVNTGVAVHRQRELFHEIAMAWVSAAPNSSEAHEALAVARELLQDPSALDEIGRARALSSDPGQRIRLAVSEVWLRVKFAIPRDTAGLRIARDLADSLVSANGSHADVETLGLAGVALLVGQANIAAGLTRDRTANDHEGVPPQLSPVALPLLAFAALGGPTDSIKDLERELSAAIQNRIPAQLQGEARGSWLVRPARLAFPNYRFSEVEDLGHLDFFVSAQLSALKGDPVAVRRMFGDIKRTRRSIKPSDIPPEGVYAEAELLRVIGDVPAAVAWLDPWLATLAGTAPGTLASPANAGTLMRAVALRADLADQTKDRDAARKWASVVTIMWQNADGFLQPTVARMRRMRGL